MNMNIILVLLVGGVTKLHVGKKCVDINFPRNCCTCFDQTFIDFFVLNIEM
jgi:hypothetical protein